MPYTPEATQPPGLGRRLWSQQGLECDGKPSLLARLSPVSPLLPCTGLADTYSDNPTLSAWPGTALERTYSFFMRSSPARVRARETDSSEIRETDQCLSLSARPPSQQGLGSAMSQTTPRQPGIRHRTEPPLPLGSTWHRQLAQPPPRRPAGHPGRSCGRPPLRKAWAGRLVSVPGGWQGQLCQAPPPGQGFLRGPCEAWLCLPHVAPSSSVLRECQRESLGLLQPDHLRAGSSQHR